MILDHCDHRVLHILLLVGQALVRVLLELLGQGLDDDVGVADLLAVQLHEGQEAALRAELRVVGNVLKVARNLLLGTCCWELVVTKLVFQKLVAWNLMFQELVAKNLLLGTCC